MENNLKTFPHRESGCDCCDVFWRWREDFEAKHRKNLKDLVRYSNYAPTIRTLENYIKKEVLGEG